MIIDLRSDTVTKPTPAMLEAMMTAEVGDDVFSEDPTIAALEEKVAAMFGMEAGLFCPSGTMTNQIAIRTHTKPMDEVICHEYSHIYQYETGGYAANSGVSVKLIPSKRGIIHPEDITSNVQPAFDWLPHTSLVVLENTCNKGGGSVYDLDNLKATSATCRQHELKLHLDGARLFNAMIATGQKPEDYHGLFDSISICFSKGLGAPVGSALLGSRAFIKQARRVRKVFGGGMRQGGYLAAACIHALDHHVDRLKDDHLSAATLGATLEALDWVQHVLPVESNIVIFELSDRFTPASFLKQLSEKGILAVQFGPKAVRLVTHLDFTDEMLERTIRTLRSLV